MHIELTEMLRCVEPHQDAHLVLSTSEMNGRMVTGGVLGCPVCTREYDIRDGIVHFETDPTATAAATSAAPPVDPQTLQALLDLGGPGGYVVLLGGAARHAVGLAALMAGIHFIGVNAPADIEELPVLSLVRTDTRIPLRDSMARGVVVAAEMQGSGWLDEGTRVLLRGRRLVVEREDVIPPGMAELAAGDGLWLGEKR